MSGLVGNVEIDVQSTQKRKHAVLSGSNRTQPTLSAHAVQSAQNRKDGDLSGILKSIFSNIQLDEWSTKEVDGICLPLS